MKNRKIIIFLIILLSILAISLTFFFVNVLINKSFKFNNFIFSSKISNKLIFNKTYENIFDEISIDSNSSDIQIKHGDKIKVLIYGEKNNLEIKTTSNKLNIVSNESSCIGFCFNNIISKIEIYLPNNYNKKINVVNEYGDIRIDKFSNIILDLEINAGDIKIDSLKEATIKNKYGDTSILHADKLDINEDCGDIVIGEVNDIKVINKYGDIEIDKVTNSLNIVASAGDIEINSAYLKENSKIKNSYGDINIDKTNEIYIDAKTSFGDINVNKNYPKSNVTLTINDSCGSIEVN